MKSEEKALQEIALDEIEFFTGKDSRHYFTKSDFQKFCEGFWDNLADETRGRLLWKELQVKEETVKEMRIQVSQFLNRTAYARWDQQSAMIWLHRVLQWRVMSRFWTWAELNYFLQAALMYGEPPTLEQAEAEMYVLHPYLPDKKDVESESA